MHVENNNMKYQVHNINVKGCMPSPAGHLDLWLFLPQNLIIQPIMSQDAPATKVWRKCINAHQRYWGNEPRKRYFFSQFGHAVTLTFDHLTPKSVHLRPKMHNWQKFGENPSTPTIDIARKTSWTDAQMHACMDARTERQHENIIIPPSSTA